MSRARWLLPTISLCIALAMPVSALAQTAVNGQVFLPLVSGYDSVNSAPITAGNAGPVYGLLGRLESPANRRYVNYLATADGGYYALAGETPAVEVEIDSMAQRRPPVQVKVWGTAYITSFDSKEPMIVVSGILANGRAPVVSGASIPVALVRFDLVSLHSGPSITSSKVGEVKLDQACDVIGRNQTGTWLQLGCSDNLTGWIDGRLVQIQGDSKDVPVVDSAANQAVTVSAQATPVPAARPTPQPSNEWKMSIFDNPQLAGEPFVSEYVSNINFDWGSGAPSPLTTGDNFSLRFERVINFQTGYYRFTVQADDGVRVWLDDQRIIDEWHGTTGQVYSVGRTLSGLHDVRVEYYEGSGFASLRFNYELVNQTPEWDAAYFRGTALQGDPVFVEKEPRSAYPLDQNWYNASPAPSALGNDYWSARWTGQFHFDFGTYIFHAIADDGVRVYLDGLPVIDQWRDGYKEATNSFVDVGAGTHTIKIEYYERTGLSQIRVWWEKDLSAQ